MPMWIRAQGLLAVGFGVAITGCGDSEIKSDLNTDGPPRVIAVTVRSEQAVRNRAPQGEYPTFCSAREGDYGQEKLHAVCTDALDALEEGQTLPQVRDALPFGWHVRLIFNELLDGSQVETFAPAPWLGENVYGEPIQRGTLAETQPVIVRCGGDPVAYDGYYDPAGSNLTNPPGPSLVVHLPLDPDRGTPSVEGFVATSSECEIEVKAELRAKDGERMLSSARGPFSFGIAPLAVVGTSPSTGAEGIGVGVQPRISFNAPISIDSLVDAEGDRITLTPEGGEPVALTFSLQEDNPATPQREDDPATIVVVPAAELERGTTYTLALRSGVADIKGGTLDVGAEPMVIGRFSTGPSMLLDGGIEVDAGLVDAAQ